MDRAWTHIIQLQPDDDLANTGAPFSGADGTLSSPKVVILVPLNLWHKQDVQPRKRMRGGRSADLHKDLLQKFALTLYDFNSYGHNFQFLWSRAVREQAPQPCRMIIHADQRLTTDHARSYKGPTSQRFRRLFKA